MTSARPIKLGFWGAGNWASRLATAAKTTGQVEIARCWGANPEGDAAFAARHETSAAASEEDFLATPGLEAIIVTTPNGLHLAHALKALERGLAVFVEKPMCATREESARLVEAARGRVLFTGHNTRRETRFRRAKALLESGAIGRPQLAHIVFTSRAGLQGEVGAWRFDPAQCPALALSQIGVHAVDALHYLFGLPARVSGMIRVGAMGRGLEDLCTAQMEFPGPVLATLTNGYSVKTERSLMVLGTDGIIDSPSATTLRATRHDGTLIAEETIAPNDTLAEELSEFACSVRGEATPETDVAVGYAAVAVVEALRESSASSTQVAPDFSPIRGR
jgi:predicted dehydrogenase